jgi:hypothetical protein
MALTERTPLHNAVDEMREQIADLQRQVADLSHKARAYEQAILELQKLQQKD